MTLKSIAHRGLNALHRAAAHLPAFGSFRPLRGGFSAFEMLRDRDLPGGILANGQSPGKCPPGSMTALAGFQQHDHQPWPIFWTMSTDARLVGGMLYWRDADDRLCKECVYGLTERRRLGEDHLFAQMMVSDPQFLPGAWTSISSNWNDGGNYYHWMLDGLSRLSVRDTLPEKTKILLPRNLPRFARETLTLLGLENDCVAAPSDCLKPERYYFCSPTAMTGVWNPSGCQWLRHAFASFYREPGSGPPVFLTRRGRARIPHNLDDIEKLFQKHGFEIIDCGAISVREQIRSTSGATAIAGLHGAAMTNLLWAAPGTRVIELFQPGYINGCYEQIAFEGGLEYSHQTIGPDGILESLERWCQTLRC